MRKALLLVASPRKGGNSDILADVALQEIVKHNIEAKKIYVSDLKINPCCGCLRCNLLGYCTQKDDFALFLKEFNDSNVVIIASPVYFWNVPGPLKILIDRFRSVMHVTVQPEKLICKSTMSTRKNFLVILVQGEPTGNDFKPAYQLLNGFAKRVCNAGKVLSLAAKGLPMKGQVKMSSESLRTLFEKLSLPTDETYVSERLQYYRKICSKVCKLVKDLLLYN